MRAMLATLAKREASRSIRFVSCHATTNLPINGRQTRFGCWRTMTLSARCSSSGGPPPAVCRALLSPLPLPASLILVASFLLFSYPLRLALLLPTSVHDRTRTQNTYDDLMVLGAVLCNCHCVTYKTSLWAYGKWHWNNVSACHLLHVYNKPSGDFYTIRFDLWN